MFLSVHFRMTVRGGAKNYVEENYDLTNMVIYHIIQKRKNNMPLTSKNFKLKLSLIDENGETVSEAKYPIVISSAALNYQIIKIQ